MYELYVTQNFGIFRVGVHILTDSIIIIRIIIINKTAEIDYSIIIIHLIIGLNRHCECVCGRALVVLFFFLEKP